jgi:hypothetical protein
MTRSDGHEETVLNTELAPRLAQIKQEAMRRGVVAERAGRGGDGQAAR